ncbi:MAG: hypothetical protein PVH18_06455 [Chloroflexota bacterium]
MKRKFLPLTIVIVSLSIILGLLYSIQLVTASMPENPNIGTAIAELMLEPQEQGRFTQASSTVVFEVAVQNIGDAPTDTYEVILDTVWSTSLFGPDGSTPLTDTNSSGIIDTGVILQGESFSVTAKIDTPPSAVVGDANTALLTFRSTISPSVAMTASMQSAVPAPFVQSLYREDERSLIISQPNASWRAQTTPNSWDDATSNFPGLAVAETVSGYAHLWSSERYNGSAWVQELEYRLTDKSGVPISAIDKLTDHASVSQITYDRSPAIAIAPNGNIGVTWYQEEDNGSQRYNVFLSILDASGQPVTDTISLTNNSDWREPGQPNFNIPAFSMPRIAATGDDHFFVAWVSSVPTYTDFITETHDVFDVNYAIYAGDGVSVTEATNISNNVPGEPTLSLAPAMAGVGADRVFLSWAQWRPPEDGGDDILYTVIDSSNATIKTLSEMAGDDDPVNWYNFDVVELSGGRIMAAWLADGCPGYDDPDPPRIRYAVFRDNNYNRIGQPYCLPPTVMANGGDDAASLVADNSDQAVLTWTDRSDSQRRSLYYTLLYSDGTPLTEPMIFYQTDRLSTGIDGYGSASRIYRDAAISIDPASANGIAGQPVTFTVEYGNSGSVTGTDVAVTLTLATSLTYQADTAPIAPTIDGQNVVWEVADLLPWSKASFSVTVMIDEAAADMSNQPLTISIGVAGQEATLANNSDSALIKIEGLELPIYIPIISKPS